MSPILNYTTSIAVDKSVAEIQKCLAKCGNMDIMVSYENGAPSAISFRLASGRGVLSFLLPAKIDTVFGILKNSHIARSLKTRDQAARVAWRIIKDWVEAQVAFIQSGQVEASEVFFAFIQLETGDTLYETTKKSGFERLLLPPPK